MRKEKENRLKLKMATNGLAKKKAELEKEVEMLQKKE